MLLRQLRFVCAQPATKYYAWQVEVMINNFIEMGVNPNYIDIVCWKQNGIIPEEWELLRNHYNYVRFFFYDDTRTTKHYISSIRPNILKQHWEANPELENDAIFYHDSDIVFTKNMYQWITSEMLEDENWYGSDTRWYIAHSYIIGKGEDVLDKMCEIVDIPKVMIEENEQNAIGAQYLMKGIDYNFWNDVERDSENLFRDITALNNLKKQDNPNYHELQIWCADMWAVLWNGWKRGAQTICHPNFDFSWGTSTEDDYHKLNIMHNAGVTGPNMGLFYKASYMNSLPYFKDLQIADNTASKKYYEWIQKTEKKTCLSSIEQPMVVKTVLN
jgi:hypothetical protein